MTRRGSSTLLTVLALVSGSCALAYEVLFVRALTSVLGDMFYVHAALLSTFLVGVGLGAKTARHWRRFLWAFEILTGLYALALPLATRWFAGLSGIQVVTASPLLTIVATVGFIAIPSILIGFSIPLFSAYIKHRIGGRLAFQRIYMAYNLGALLSVLAVELLLIRYAGVRLSLAVVGAFNVISGILLFVTRAAPPRAPAERPRRFARRTIIALALASLCSAAFQMFFLKLCYLVFMPHRENFAIGLGVTMLGIFLGAWFASRVKIRFETVLLLAAGLLGLTYVAYMPILDLWEATASWSRQSELLILVHKFGIACLFALGPMAMFGATIPVLMRTEDEVAGESGYLLWVASLSNAAGYLVYVLLGHPLLETDVLLVVIGGGTVAAAAIASRLRWSRLDSGLAAVALALFVLLLLGRQEHDFYLAQHRAQVRPQDEIFVYKSGAESATLLRADTFEWISYNGHPSIYIQTDGVINAAEVISGVIPALGARRLDRALVLGLGAGITAGAASRIFTQTDVVEINDAFYKMMPAIGHVNFEIERNPGVELHLSDGRAFLIGKEGIYDAIVNSIPAPTYFSASKIYTLEFYERVARALKPDGVFCTWIGPEMSEQGIMTVASGLHHSFSFCDLRLMRGHYYMATCSNEPIQVRAFSDLPAAPRLVEELHRSVPFFDLDEYFEDTRISTNLFEHQTPTVPRENTDDFPVLEFLVVRGQHLRDAGDDPFLVDQRGWNIDPVRRAGVDRARFVRRAGLFSVLSPEMFQRNFLPLIRHDPAMTNAFVAWQAEMKNQR